MPLSQTAQSAALKALFGSVPDGVLSTLEKAVSDSGPAMKLVQEIIAAERADRALREVVLGPVGPLFRMRERGPSFPARLRAAIWAALKSREAELVDEAAEAVRYLRSEDQIPMVLDELCLRAAAMLREPGGPVMRAGDEAMGEDLAAYFELAPLTRRILPRLPDWLGRVSDERTATLKIALRDASALMQDGAPRLLEILQAHLPEPHLILRIISVATDRASDRYLADSELAIFGDRLLDEVDERVERVRTFDPSQPVALAVSIGAEVTQSCAILAELERAMELSRDGAWGKRATTARRKLAATVESRLRDVEDAMARALPMRKVRTVGRMTRAAPCLDKDPDPKSVERAQGLFALLESTRAAAQVGGYGALRASVAEKLRERLSDYVDEVVHLLNGGGEVDEDRARQFLELAAEFLERADDPKAAQVARRRAAVAGALTTSQGAA